MAVALPRRLPAPATARPVRRMRVALADGAETTVHVAAYDLAATELRIALLRGQQLTAYCAARGIDDAIVGGFFTRPQNRPLGELRMRGVVRAHVPFDAPWADVRACVNSDGEHVVIARRHELPAAPRGDLLQAGPLLVRDGRPAFDRGTDVEGFSAGAHQFDSDITAERHPRAALAVTEDRLLAVACDGRAQADAGMTLAELAELLVALGARAALNLDGGGSTTLVAGGRLRNRPRAAVGVPEPGGRGIATALLLLPRR